MSSARFLRNFTEDSLLCGWFSDSLPAVTGSIRLSHKRRAAASLRQPQNPFKQFGRYAVASGLAFLDPDFAMFLDVLLFLLPSP